MAGRAEWSATWKTPIQQDLNAAAAASLTWKQFLRTLEKQGYAFRFDRKHPALILPGNGRTVRFKTLGKQYTPEALQRRILYPKPPCRAGKEHPPANRFLLLLGETQPRRLSGLRALYFSYLYKMGALPKKPGIQAMLCGRISASWTNGLSRRNSSSKTT